ncbi:arginase family protein [Xanthomonas sp. NCPPB 3443]|uniref:arginase family protein n=1 Tax=Xanthomonas sp. NCPPB 3443 TaxID=3243407 RepID=UPI0035591333
MSTQISDKTLRLVFPQWQGGDNPLYHFGTRLLSWLSPAPTGPVEHVEVPEPNGEAALPRENGIVARSALLRQQRHARELIDKHNPDRLVILGGDCLVDLAPFAWLNERYGGDLAVLWVDAHPDVLTPVEFERGHAMVLGNLLGKGDREFVDTVRLPVKPQNVMFAGLGPTSTVETQFIERLNLAKAGPGELADTSAPVLDWLRAVGAKHVAVHLDLDVLDVSKFHALYFGKPDAPEGAFDGIAQGKMTMQQVIRLLGDVSQVVDVVGLGITEHLPWDAINLKNMLASLPLIGRP